MSETKTSLTRRGALAGAAASGAGVSGSADDSGAASAPSCTAHGRSSSAGALCFKTYADAVHWKC